MTEFIKVTFDFYNTSRQVKIIVGRDDLSNKEWSKYIRSELDSEDVFSIVTGEGAYIDFKSQDVLMVKVEDAEDTTVI